MAPVKNRLQDVLCLMLLTAGTCFACGKTPSPAAQTEQSGTGGGGGLQATADNDAATGVRLPSGCAPPGLYQCNPVTNEGCDTVAGEACDDDLYGGFMCYPAPNDVPVGGACNIVDGPSCRSGAVCQGATDANPNGLCAPYCCSDLDCSSGATCRTLDQQYGSLGYCQ